MLAVAVLSVLTACGGGGGVVADNINGLSAGIVEIPNSGNVSVETLAVGVTFFQVLGNDEIILQGETYDGAFKVIYANSNSSNVMFEFVSGVVKNITKNDSGVWSFRIDASQLAAGFHPYVIRAIDKATGKESTLTGTVKIITPLVERKITLSSAGASIVVETGNLVLSASNLLQSLDITVKSIPLDGGVQYRIQSPISLKDAGVQIQFPVSNQNTGLVQSLVSGLKRIQAGVIALATTGSSSPILNMMPYSDSGIDISGLLSQGNFAGKSLGSLVLKGDPGTAFQPITNNLGIDLGQRIFNNQAYAGNSNSWYTVPFEFIKTVGSNVVHESLITQLVPWELHTSIAGDPEKFNWDAGYEPVLFIHGYSTSYGGAEGTWSKFPNLILQTKMPNTGNALVPFEFRWRTGQSFRLAAADLATAISYIYRVSKGRKVHIISHSMGGVLTRTMLQDLAYGGPAEAKNKVASVVSLGTPYSGIALAEQVVGSKTIPGGAFQGYDIIATCQHISCYELGGTSLLFDANIAAKVLQDVGLTGDFQTRGMLITKLSETESALPNIPIYQGIGMQKAVTGDFAVNGDGLISFAGQRFQTSGDTDAMARALLSQTKIGQASVTEVLLGLTPNMRPAADWVANKLPTNRKNGYAHSSSAGIANGNLLNSDGGFLLGRGLEAAPSDLDCDSPLSCTHAGYMLFRQIQNDELNWSNVSYQHEITMPARLLMPIAGLSAQDAAIVQSILDDAKTDGIISGRYINWEKLSEIKRQKYWTAMQALADSIRVTQLKDSYATQSASLGDYFEANLAKANRSAVGKGIASPDAINDWLAVGAQEVKIVSGILRIAYPAAAMAAEKGEKLVGASDSVQKALKILVVLNRTAKFLDIVNACPNMLDTYQAAMSRLNAETFDAGDLIDATTIPLSCLGSIISAGDMDKASTLIGSLSDGIDVAGARMHIHQAVINLLDGVLAVAPDSTNLQYAKGTVNIVSAFLDATAAGKNMSDRADKAFLIDFEKFDQTSKSFDKLLLEARTLSLLHAKFARV